MINSFSGKRRDDEQFRNVGHSFWPCAGAKTSNVISLRLNYWKSAEESCCCQQNPENIRKESAESDCLRALGSVGEKGTLAMDIFPTQILKQRHVTWENERKSGQSA